MPLSGVAMISENTAAASSSRFAGSLCLASRGASARVAARIIRILNLFGRPGEPRRAWATPSLVHESHQRVLRTRRRVALDRAIQMEGSHCTGTLGRISSSESDVRLPLYPACSGEIWSFDRQGSRILQEMRAYAVVRQRYFMWIHGVLIRASRKNMRRRGDRLRGVASFVANNIDRWRPLNNFKPRKKRSSARGPLTELSR